MAFTGNFPLVNRFFEPAPDPPRPPRSRRRLGLRRLESAAPPALASLFAFFRHHLLPPLGHSLSHLGTHIGTMRAANTKPPEQDPAKQQQSKRLPERNLPPAEQRRQQPIPEMHHQLSANVHE